MYAFQTSRFQSHEPKWLDCQKFPRSALPAADARWLLDVGSLTAHLRRVSNGHFHVEVLVQRWQIPRLSERRLLGMGDRHWGLGEKCAYIATIVPGFMLAVFYLLHRWLGA